MTAFAQRRERLQHAWQVFRARSVYFQLKTLVVVAYAAVVVATVLVVFRPHWRASNTHKARIVLLPGDPIMGRYIVVQNDSSRDWIGVRFEIDGGYKVRRDAVLAGEKITLFVHQFAKAEVSSGGKPQMAPASLVPSRLRIESSAGAMVEPLRASR